MKLLVGVSWASPFRVFRKMWRARGPVVRRRLIQRLCLAAYAALATPLALASDTARIVVVHGTNTPRIAQTLAALHHRADVRVDVIPLSSTPAAALETVIADESGDTVVVALGPQASDYMLKVAARAPVVHCLAGVAAQRAGLPTVPSEVPGEHQALWLRKLVPNARSIGMLFEPGRHTRRTEAMAAALSSAGYETVLQPVDVPAALPAALESVAERVDVLLALRDPIVYTRETSRGILLFLLRRRIPLIGPDDAWVRSGALFALDWDYDEVGYACAAHAARAMPGAGPRPEAPPMPSIRVSVNRKVAAGLGLHWSPEVLRDVDIRHE